MYSAQLKLNEIIRLCTELSTNIHETSENTVHQNPISNTVNDKINYDIIV